MLRVDWQYGADHMWVRHQVTTNAANEALSDVEAVWLDPDPKSRSGRGIRVIGYCGSRQEVLTLISRSGTRCGVVVGSQRLAVELQRSGNYREGDE